MQNQAGNTPLKWNNTGTVVEVKPHRQYRIMIDGSRRITLRNRRFIKKIQPSLRNYTSAHDIPLHNILQDLSGAMPNGRTLPAQPMSPIDFCEAGQPTECMHPMENTRSAPPRDETVHITPDAVTEQDQPDNETQQAMPVQQVDTPRAGHSSPRIPNGDRNVTFANIKPRRSQRETKGRPPNKLDL